jgi:RHS repeat-associated protein
VHYHESTPQERVAEAFTRPSTGLVYMQARYYDPAVGRFTQLDPVRYGPELFATGQNNRWTYCANDPVNATDTNGEWSVPLTSPFGLSFLGGSIAGSLYAAWALGDISIMARGTRLAFNAAIATRVFRKWLAEYVIRGCAFETLKKMDTNPALWRAEVYGIGFLGGYSFGALTYAIVSLFGL